MHTNIYIYIYTHSYIDTYKLHTCTYIHASCSLIQRLWHPALLQMLNDPSLVTSIAPWLVHWFIACTIHRAFDCSLINRWYHPPFIQLITDPTLFPSSAPSLANWSIACIIQCSFDSSLIPRLHFPSLLGLLTDPSLLPGSVLLCIKINRWGLNLLQEVLTKASCSLFGHSQRSKTVPRS